MSKLADELTAESNKVKVASLTQEVERLGNCDCLCTGIGVLEKLKQSEAEVEALKNLHIDLSREHKVELEKSEADNTKLREDLKVILANSLKSS